MWCEELVKIINYIGYSGGFMWFSEILETNIAVKSLFVTNQDIPCFHDFARCEFL